MNQKLSQAVEDLVHWRTSSVSIHKAPKSGTGHPMLEAFGTTAPLVKFPEMAKASDHELQIRSAVEPEFHEAVEAVEKAIDGLHAAREAIIERKARELAALVHGDQIAGIQESLNQIRGAGA